MTFEELLEQNPALRRLRSLDADTLRRLFGRIRKECTWCGNLVGKNRSTWCSQNCVDQFSHRCCPGKSAAFVYKRDNGICQLCGIDVTAHEREFDRLMREQREQINREIFSPYSREFHAEERRIRAELQERFCFARGRWYEVDHEIPVVEGGGLCHPDQLRLLCGKCHARETADLQARLAARRAEKTNQTTKPKRKEKRNVDR